ncbi:uroporphyrinogen III C-methyltransferase [Yersinia enterocolitica subsp. enterocolitica]|nr:uroporphyrinogen III C-methyltransferase [Yersinia enterocolitica subsp. enterocolitica]
MTEQNTPSAPVEETTTAAERHQQPEPEIRREKKSGPILGAIAIALAIALGAGLYYHGHQQAQLQEAGKYCAARTVSRIKAESVTGKTAA